MKKKITIKKNAKHWHDKYPLVSVTWKDISSDASWQSFKQLMSAELPVCVTKGHLLSQSRGITRIFGDVAKSDKGEIEEIGNTTIIPNSVIVKIEKI